MNIEKPKKVRINKHIFSILLAASVSLMPMCSNAQNVNMYKCKVEGVLNHDASSYTQGLFCHNGDLYESAGQYGESSMRKVDLNTGKVLKRKNFDTKYFVEGSCIVNGNLYILTWQEGTCFVCDPATFDQRGMIRYSGEGWGLTTDGKYLIMSDGSSTLYFLDPESFIAKKSITVTLKGSKMSYLNELEYIEGSIWANVYGADDILIIDPSDGTVTCRSQVRSSLTLLPTS